jgi:hypothetical protein
MNGRIAKKLRKKLISGDILLTVVQEYGGEKTKEMNQRQLYQKVKKMYKEGKIKV